jgi:hypothetical protein
MFDLKSVNPEDGQYEILQPVGNWSHQFSRYQRCQLLSGYCERQLFYSPINNNFSRVLDNPQ